VTGAARAARASSGSPALARGDMRLRLRVGHLWIDRLTRDEALAEVSALVETGRGGSVFTPNVHHVVMAESNAAFRAAYDRANLTLADGAPIVWASRILRPPLPAKLSGSDMVRPIAQLAAQRGWRLYLLGGSPGAALRAAQRLTEAYGLAVVGTDDSQVGIAADAAVDEPILDRIRRARPDIIFVGLGAPKQELWIDRMSAWLVPAVAIGVGASIDFLSGAARRAPRWMSGAGLEWVHRLSQDPRRLWRRYLLQGPTYGQIVLRSLRLPRDQRVRSVPPARSSNAAPQ